MKTILISKKFSLKFLAIQNFDNGFVLHFSFFVSLEFSDFSRWKSDENRKQIFSRHQKCFHLT